MKVSNSPNAIFTSGQYAQNPKIGPLLMACGLSSAELAKRVGVFPSTVSSWTTGKRKTPGAVIAYLQLLAKVQALGK